MLFCCFLSNFYNQVEVLPLKTIVVKYAGFVMKILRVDINKLNGQILALVLNQSPISAIPPIVQFSLDPKIAISEDPLYLAGEKLMLL